MAKVKKPFIPQNKIEKKYYREYLRLTHYTDKKRLSEDLSFNKYFKYRMATCDIHKNYDAALTAEKITNELMQKDDWHREYIMRKSSILMFPHDFGGRLIGTYGGKGGDIQKKRDFIYNFLHRHVEPETGTFIKEEKHSRYMQLIRDELEAYRRGINYNLKNIKIKRLMLDIKKEIIDEFSNRLKTRKTTDEVIGEYIYSLKVVKKRSGMYGLEHYYGY